jgi:hypothetical protein
MFLFRSPNKPVETNNKTDSAFIAARSRVQDQIAPLAQARGVMVGVEIDPGRTSSDVHIHLIQLTNGRCTRTVGVDHETFMDAAFFRTLVLHRLEAAIEELAASA